MLKSKLFGMLHVFFLWFDFSVKHLDVLNKKLWDISHPGAIPEYLIA